MHLVKKLAVAFLASLLLGAGGGTALASGEVEAPPERVTDESAPSPVAAEGSGAASISSEWGQKTFNGYTYRNYSTLYYTPNQAQANTATGRYPLNTTRAGDAGAYGRLYTGGGALSCSSTWKYNTSAGVRAAAASCLRYAAGSWYAQGASKGWNGRAYESFGSFKTRTITTY